MLSLSANSKFSIKASIIQRQPHQSIDTTSPFV
jgi:hypothetical protein